MFNSIKFNVNYLRDKTVGGILSVCLRLIQLPLRAQIGVVIILFLCGVVFYAISHRHVLVGQGKLLLKEENPSAKQVTQFLDRCLEEINSVYRMGHNETLRGIKETKTWMNNYQDVTGVQLSINLYVAKGYFERMMEAVSQFPELNHSMREIKDFLLRAARFRVEAINLYTSGFLLKEQIGKTLINNLLADKEKGKVLPIPAYHGEIEQGLSKIPLANSYLEEALKKMKVLSDQVKLTKFYDTTIATPIGHYSETAESESGAYVRSAERALVAGDYFQAIMAFSKTLKVNPTDQPALLGLVKAYREAGDKEKFEETLNSALATYPADKELNELKAKGVPDVAPASVSTPTSTGEAK